MRSVSYRLADLNHVTVPLGFRGENEHTRVIIDCKKAFDEYPNAIPSLAVSPPNGAAYPAVIVRDGDLVYWDVRDSDLAKEGRGTAQLTFTEDGVVRKDDIFKTVIGKSILPAGPAPDPIADWITEANRSIGTIEGAIETAQEAAEAASGSATAAAGSATDAANQATAAAESEEAARSAAGEAAQKADDAAESARASASSATAAAGSANSAAGSATQAAGSAEAAAGSAVEAGTSAAAAAGSAAAAAESAANASEAEANASEQATAAAASEANAADSATAAATSETNAANSETNAAASATAAAGSASDAAESATAASGSATAAEGSANAAAASAASAASAAEALIDDTSTATNKTWSAKKSSTVMDALQKDKAPVIIDHAEGNPIVLTDGADGLPVEGMKIHFLPKQNLNGQDAPYPPGGGKNKLNVTATSNTIGNVEYTVNADGSVKANGTANTTSILNLGTFTLPAGDYLANGITGGQSGQYLIRIYSGSTTVKYVYDGDTAFSLNADTEITIAIYVYNGCTVSNKIFYPMIRLASVTDPTFAPYSNICPISGWEGLTAWRTGKNLFDISVFANKQGVTIDGSMFYGYADAFSVATSGGVPFYVKKGTTLTIRAITHRSASDTGAGWCVYFVYADGTLIRPFYTANSVTTPTEYTGTITAEQDIVAYKLTFFNNPNTGIWYVDKLMFEIGSTASQYAEYAGASYPVTFPDGQTVYGGTLDAVTGVLTVTHAMVDMGDIEWSKSTAVSSVGGSIFTKNIASLDPPMAQRSRYTKNTMLSDQFKTGNSNLWFIADMADYEMFSNATNIFISASDYDNTNDFKAAMSGVQLVYELATPVEIQLDPIIIQTLLGDNTIWSDANGTIELDYRADTKLFIAKNKQDIRATIAPIEDGTTASKAYSAGKLFYHDGNLCKAKTSIASGAAFTLNTNYTITTVADELFALN